MTRFTGSAFDAEPVPAAVEDPFATPLFDPATGEVLEPEAAPVAAPAGPGPLVAGVDLRADAHAYAGELRRALEDRVALEYDALLAERPDGPLEVAVQPELRYLADASAVFAELGKVFTDLSRRTRGMAGDLVLESRPSAAERIEKSGGSASTRVRSSAGEVKVTTTQPTETFAETDQLVDVLVAHLVGDLGSGVTSAGAAEYAAGARAMARALQDVTSPWSWKSSALDALRRAMPDALAARLAKAYGRRPKGEARTTIEAVKP